MNEGGVLVGLDLDEAKTWGEDPQGARLSECATV